MREFFKSYSRLYATEGVTEMWQPYIAEYP